MSANEFARPVRIDSLGPGPRELRIAAEPAERAALATRFGLVAIERIEAAATLRRDGDVVVAEGRLRGEAIQHCVATGVPLPAQVDVPFTLRFQPADAPPGDEIELSEADCDTLDYEGGAIDLGEAVAEEFILALDPFPRASDAEARLREAGVVGEEDAGPFAALKGLRDRLGEARSKD